MRAQRSVVRSTQGAGMTKWVDVRLVYDTKAQPLSSGVRAVLQRARRLLYAADETELVLQIAPGMAAMQQLMGPQGAGPEEAPAAPTGNRQ